MSYVKGLLCVLIVVLSLVQIIESHGWWGPSPWYRPHFGGYYGPRFGPGFGPWIGPGFGPIFPPPPPPPPFFYG